MRPIWGLELHPPDPEAGDQTFDLALDNDFIVERLCGVGAPGRAQFRVAPAIPRFHTVSDLRLAIAGEYRGAAARDAHRPRGA